MKTKLTIALLLLSLAVPVVKARVPTPELGVRLSMELGFPSGGYSCYKTGAGLTVGPTVKFPMSRGFFFESSLLFSYTGFSSKYLVEFDDRYLYEGSANLYTLRIPLEFGYDYRLGDSWLMSFATGPWLNFNIRARQALSPNFQAPVIEPEHKISLFDYGWKRVDAQWGIRLSVTFAEHYYVGITTGVAFTPLAKFGNRDKKIRIYRNTIGISLGYNF